VTATVYRVFLPFSYALDLVRRSSTAASKGHRRTVLEGRRACNKPE